MEEKRSAEGTRALTEGEKRTYGDLIRCFDGETGDRVLSWFSRVCGVRETVTVEEAAGRAPDTNRLLVNEGMRRAYWKLAVMVEKARAQAQKGEKRE